MSVWHFNDDRIDLMSRKQPKLKSEEMKKLG